MVGRFSIAFGGLLCLACSAFAEETSQVMIPYPKSEIEACVLGLLQGAEPATCPAARPAASPQRPRFVYSTDFRSMVRLVLELRASEHETPLRIDVGFEGDALRVRSSHSKLPQLAGGVRMRRSAQKGQSVVIEGRDGADLVVGLWPARSAEVPAGAVICPFTMAIEPGAEQAPTLAIKPSSYRPAAVQYQVQGSARGSITTIRGVGFARATIQTTPNIPAPDPWEDQVRSGDPEVDIEYMQIGGAAAPVWKPWAGEPVVGGAVLRILFDLPNRFYKTFERVRYTAVREVAVPGGLSTTIRQRPVQVPGERCILIMSEMRTDETEELREAEAAGGR